MSETLHWERDNLYIMHGTQRRFVGTVVLSSFGKTWGVFVRGEHKNELPSETDARQQLEKYALEMTWRKRP